MRMIYQLNFQKADGIIQTTIYLTMKFQMIQILL